MSQLIGCITQKADWFAVVLESHVKLLNVAGRRLAVAKQEGVRWSSVTCAPDSKRFASVGEQGNSKKSLLCAWEYDSQRLRLLWKKPLAFAAQWVACSDALLAVASSETFLSMRWTTGEIVNQVRLPQPMLCAHFQPNAAWLGDERGNLWRIDNNTARKIANFGVGEIFCIDSLQNTLYLGSADTLIHTYDIATSQPGRRMLGHRSEVACLQCKPQQIVSIGLQGDISLWNPESLYPQQRLQIEGELPQAIAYEPDRQSCWTLLANGLHQIDWKQSRARLVLSRDKITQA